MKKIGLVVLFMISTEVLFAQNFDEERMKRDLEVAKNQIYERKYKINSRKNERAQ